MIGLSSSFCIRALIYLPLLVFFSLFCVNIAILWSKAGSSVLFAEWLPSVRGADEQQVGIHLWQKLLVPDSWHLQKDQHPIRRLVSKAKEDFDTYERSRSKTFKEAVEKYRSRYGRHPPPGYKEWYKFARKLNIHDIDDFQQVHDDLRPFWAVEPSVIRNHASHCVDDPGYGLSILSVRGGRVYQPQEGWRPETFAKMLKKVAHGLPDMDIPINLFDQPRMVIPWEDLQEMLKVEESTRSLAEDGISDGYTKDMSNFWVPTEDIPDTSWSHTLGMSWIYNDLKAPAAGNDEAPDWGFFGYPGQHYMDLCSKACPPDSYARNANSSAIYKKTEQRYKDVQGGLITNFNLSTDLCTVGPQLTDIHGMLYASTSMSATYKLVPIFGECKVSVNNDILFPANMYYKLDPRYEYDDEDDIAWDHKEDLAPWRGVTSGGTVHAEEGDKWKQMHRQRLVLLTNSTVLADEIQPILALSDAEEPNSEYSHQAYRPADFAADHTDIGFTEMTACIPDCTFLEDQLTMLDQIDFTQTFRSKYLIDVDGMSFSGRWRAFLQSRSLGIKATIFREWHDTRLWAWKHFVPLDNRYDELYSLLAYFIGTEQQLISASGVHHTIKVPRHDYEAYQIAQAGRDRSAKVLRRVDIEIYLYRLLLEYGRVIDDHRAVIGFVGDGGKEMEDFDRQYPAMP